MAVTEYFANKDDIRHPEVEILRRVQGLNEEASVANEAYWDESVCEWIDVGNDISDMLANDGTLREIQRYEAEWARPEAFDRDAKSVRRLKERIEELRPTFVDHPADEYAALVRDVESRRPLENVHRGRSAEEVEVLLGVREVPQLWKWNSWDEVMAPPSVADTLETLIEAVNHDPSRTDNRFPKVFGTSDEMELVEFRVRVRGELTDQDVQDGLLARTHMVLAFRARRAKEMSDVR